MEVADYGTDYNATVGALARHLRQTTGSGAGDPDRAEQAILKLATAADPPLPATRRKRRPLAPAKRARRLPRRRARGRRPSGACRETDGMKGFRAALGAR